MASHYEESHYEEAAVAGPSRETEDEAKKGRPIRAALNPTKSSHSDNSPALMHHSPEVNAGGATRLHKPKGARPVRSTINPSKNCHSGHIPGLTSQSQEYMGRSSASRVHLHSQVSNYSISGARPVRSTINPSKKCHSGHIPGLTFQSQENMGRSYASRLHLHSQVSNYSISGARPVRLTINPSKKCHSEHIPGLTSHSQDIGMGRSSASRLLKSQVTVVKAPPSETNEFTMSSEDFPELPGTQRMKRPSPGGSLTVEKNLSVSSSDIGQETTVGNRAPGAEKSQTKRGIQTSLDGKVTGIPGSMVKEQFGMVGLLTFIRAALTDHRLISLAIGQDLTALGLNLNTRDHLYPNFGGPWAETPCRPQDIDFHVPPEYLNNANIRDKLRPVQFNRYDDDLLFYMFYTNIGDVAQLAAARELYNRGWRYHIEEKVWITLAPGMWADVKTYTYERGTYLYFDAQNWRKVRKDFILYYSKLEGRPQIPSTINQSPIVM